MVYIADHQSEDAPVSMSRIAEALMLSDAYLEQLLRLLKKDHFVTSTRGVKGGYVLARPAEEITVLELLNTLEGEFWLADCAVAGDCPAGFSNCPTRLVIHRMNHAIYESMKDLTLADMTQTWNAV